MTVEGVQWIAPEDIFEHNGNLSNSGWAEEIDEKKAKVLFSPIEQKDEEPDEVEEEVEEEPGPEEEEVKSKRKYKK